MSFLTIKSKNQFIEGEFILPASKSISNRALIIRFLSEKKPVLNNLSESDDTKLLQNLLDITEINKNSKSVTSFYCDNAGTVLRFLTAMLSITPGNWLLNGSDRMLDRPVGILVDGLKKLGANIVYTGKTGYPPVLIEGKMLKGGRIEIDGSVSSQFISALLMIAPMFEDGLEIELLGKVSSRPYIEMTLNLMDYFGVKSVFKNNNIFIKKQSYLNRILTIETDWTSASYWYEIAAFSEKSNITLKGLNKESIQGDAVLSEMYHQLGVKTEFLEEGIKLTRTDKIVKDFNFDFLHCPDLAQAAIVTCAGLNVAGSFSGLGNLRYKETDRLNALTKELIKLGYNVQVAGNSEIKILPSNKATEDTPKPVKIHRKLIKTYGDHRMAMAFAPLALVKGSVNIENPWVVTKSYPGFWNDLNVAGLVLSQ